MSIRYFLSIQLFVLILLSASGCYTDPCEIIYCMSGTQVDDGKICTCQCDPGFTGPHCSEPDYCALNNVECQNGGTCANGICSCPEGYEGDTCEVWLLEVTFGSYQASDNCTTAYTASVTASPGYGDRVLISNVGNLFNDPIEFIYDFETYSLTVPAPQSPDNSNIFITAEGSFNPADSSIHISYSWINTGTNQSTNGCEVDFSRL